MNAYETAFLGGRDIWERLTDFKLKLVRLKPDHHLLREYPATEDDALRLIHRITGALKPPVAVAKPPKRVKPPPREKKPPVERPVLEGVCVVCGSDFTPKKRTTLCCGPECSVKHRKALRAAWLADRPSYMKEHNAAWRAAHPDYMKDYARKRKETDA